MKKIIAQFRKLIAQFEAITPNDYDALSMQILGGF